MQLFDSLIVVKRSGQRTSFQGEKIAIAIQKAFDSIDIPYMDEDVNKIYEQVLKKISCSYEGRKTINIENIQDIIEDTLKEENFLDVYQAFSTYRNHRSASRKAFVTKQQHKFLKAIESLGLTNLVEDTRSAHQLLEKFGATISFEFAKAYLLDSKITRAHDSGLFYFHSIESMPMGSIENLEIILADLEKLDTPIGRALDKQRNIYPYLMQVIKLVDYAANELYGGITFPCFDKDLERILKKHLQDILINSIQQYEQLHELSGFSYFEALETSIGAIDSIDDIPNLLNQQFKTKPKLLLDLQFLFQSTMKQVEKDCYEAINTFIKDLPSIEFGINFGTSTSTLGRMVSFSIMKTISNRENIQYFFQVKDGISWKECDPNYDIFQAYQNILDTPACYLSFLDACFNQLEQGEICYFNHGKRVIDDNTTIEKKMVGGKGNLATVSINLVRLALNCQKEAASTKKRVFYQKLDQTLTLAKDALLTRFELQCNKKCMNFPILYKEGLWHDGEKIKPNERLRKLWKHGSLTIQFCGLMETIQLLSENKTNDMDKMAIELVQFMRKKIDQFGEENNLNFSLSATDFDFISSEFKKQDTAIFGKIHSITDKDAYCRNDEMPFSLETIGKLETYLNGGHAITLTVDKGQIKKIIEEAKKYNIGCLRLQVK